jgi:hypothetical protein
MNNKYLPKVYLVCSDVQFFFSSLLSFFFQCDGFSLRFFFQLHNITWTFTTRTHIPTNVCVRARANVDGKRRLTVKAQRRRRWILRNFSRGELVKSTLWGFDLAASKSIAFSRPIDLHSVVRCQNRLGRSVPRALGITILMIDAARSTSIALDKVIKHH